MHTRLMNGPDHPAQRTAAGRAAFERALRVGYCVSAAVALARNAERHARPGEAPAEVAERAVTVPPDAQA